MIGLGPCADRARVVPCMMRIGADMEAKVDPHSDDWHHRRVSRDDNAHVRYHARSGCWCHPAIVRVGEIVGLVWCENE